MRHDASDENDAVRSRLGTIFAHVSELVIKLNRHTVHTWPRDVHQEQLLFLQRRDTSNSPMLRGRCNITV